MPEGRGFQFTPYGFTELGDASGATALPQDFSPAFVDKNLPAAPAPASKTVTAEKIEPKPLRPSLTGPREVVRAAKARAKDIRAELRHMKALQKELTELERLIAAAKKPVAAVRPIESARHAR